eukprot:364426-Chlamydomonas_euryale.AAC.20
MQNAHGSHLCVRNTAAAPMPMHAATTQAGAEVDASLWSGQLLTLTGACSIEISCSRCTARTCGLCLTAAARECARNKLPGARAGAAGRMREEGFGSDLSIETTPHGICPLHMQAAFVKLCA